MCVLLFARLSEKNSHRLLSHHSPTHLPSLVARYDCPITAILRELLQNSVDAIDRMGGGKSVSSSSSGEWVFVPGDISWVEWTTRRFRRDVLWLVVTWSGVAVRDCNLSVRPGRVTRIPSPPPLSPLFYPPVGFEGVVRISISTLGEDITYGGKTVANAGDLAVRFSDNGIGITPDVMETLLVSVGGSDKQGRNQNKAGTERLVTKRGGGCRAGGRASVAGCRDPL